VSQRCDINLTQKYFSFIWENWKCHWHRCDV